MITNLKVNVGLKDLAIEYLRPLKPLKKIGLEILAELSVPGSYNPRIMQNNYKFSSRNLYK